jgi:hypothetical protein
MKLNKISIKNILAVKSAEIETNKPIIFVSGNNEAGKSSIRDCVAMALTGDLCRVSLKKEASWLLNGDDAGMTEVMVGDQLFYAGITKSGVTTKGQGIDGMFALPYVLDASKFAQSTPDERRKILFEISGCKATSEEIKKRMIAREIEEKLIEQIIPFLRAGFPEAQKEAQAKARDSKVRWKALTGETYGEKKAETWKAKAEGNLEEIQNSVIDKEKELAAIDADFDAASQRFGAMKAAADKATARNAEIVRLRDQAERIERIKTKLEFDKRQVIDWSAMVARAELASHGIGSDDTACHCPECGSELIFVAKDKKLIPHGDLRSNEDEAVKLPEYKRSLETCIKSVENGERDLANAEAAKARLEAIEKEIEGAPDDAAIAAITARIHELKAQKKTLNETINNLLSEEKALREADHITAIAYEHHKHVEAWEKIADALAPDGIPGELLQDALKPFNDRIKNTAGLAGWKMPAIDSDMNITVSDLPYALMSESAKWRADCVLAEAISHISGLRLLVIDRMDVLDGKSRGVFFNWLDELALANAFDTALVMGTLKHDQAEAIADAFENISVHWMQDGVLERVEAQEEAVA